mmetsp:Transcript_21502/g.31996  ORF Transcript_21502/g.31996 Transcript_21502/m.31996 type:complete len:106 (-) Transcript_21502:71-388(-)
MRFKNRFLQYRIRQEDTKTPTKEKIEYDQILQSIKQAIQLNFGDYGYACIQKSINVRLLEDDGSSFIVKVPRDSQQMARVAIAFITKVGSHRVAMQFIRASGRPS